MYRRATRWDFAPGETGIWLLMLAPLSAIGSSESMSYFGHLTGFAVLYDRDEDDRHESVGHVWTAKHGADVGSRSGFSKRLRNGSAPTGSKALTPKTVRHWWPHSSTSGGCDYGVPVSGRTRTRRPSTARSLWAGHGSGATRGEFSRSWARNRPVAEPVRRSGSARGTTWSSPAPRAQASPARLRQSAGPTWRWE